MRALAVLLSSVLVCPALPLVAEAQNPAAGASAPTVAHLARARRVLRAAPVFDGHNDLPWRIREDTVRPRDVEAYDLRTRAPGMTDLARLRKGHVGAQFWSVYLPGESNDRTYAPNGQVSSRPGFARVQLEQIDIARRVIAKYPELRWTPTASSVRTAMANGGIASLLGMEGGHAIENSLEALRQYYDLGARYMTLTHNATLDWADAANDSARHGGLTAFGREVVREMNRLGMLVDLSHVSPGTMSDALDATEAPVIFSHSGARALVDHRRNVPDSILARMARNGGVVMVPFVTSFVSSAVKAHQDSLEAAYAAATRARGSDTAAIRADIAAWSAAHPRPAATVADVANQIDHVRRLAGIDHVGIGADFDGIDENVVGLEDVSTYPNLFAELVRRGWTDAELAKLSNGNILRVLARAEQVAARLTRSRGPSQATIAQLDGPSPAARGMR
jgi:membrane dipeptidase